MLGSGVLSENNNCRWAQTIFAGYERGKKINNFCMLERKHTEENDHQPASHIIEGQHE
jgi:hypothetical protein